MYKYLSQHMLSTVYVDYATGEPVTDTRETTADTAFVPKNDNALTIKCSTFLSLQRYSRKRMDCKEWNSIQHCHESSRPKCN